MIANNDHHRGMDGGRMHLVDLDVTFLYPRALPPILEPRTRWAPLNHNGDEITAIRMAELLTTDLFKRQGVIAEDGEFNSVWLSPKLTKNYKLLIGLTSNQVLMFNLDLFHDIAIVKLSDNNFSYNIV